MINKKFWIRWSSITLLCLVYYVTMLYFDLIFALSISETMSQGREFTAAQYIWWFIQELSRNHSDSALASIVGFAVCVPFILLVFKKIR